MKRTHLLLLVGALCVSATAASGAMANDQDIIATTVPASICQPASTSSASKLRLSNGAWVFSSGQTGTAYLYCPLAKNANTQANNTYDNDISRYRVLYRDSDGGSAAASVRTRLTYRRWNGMYSGGSEWSSNDRTATGNAHAWVDNVHDLRSDAVYAFYVKLYRSSTSHTATFSGIDFYPQPVQ